MHALGDHYRAGSGEALLLIHGFTATHHAWGPLPRMLSDTFDVLAPTLPGHVGGPRLDERPTITCLTHRLQELLDEVGWKRPHVVGFSLGGWLALELAKRGRAESVFAISPGGAQGQVGGREARRIARVFKRGRYAALLGFPTVGFLSRSPAFRRLALRDMMVHGDRLEPHVAAAMIRSHATTPVFNQLLREMGDSGGLRDLEKVDVPVHLAWGERDRVLPRSHARFFLDAVPQATFQVVRRAGHVPFWDAPSDFAEQIRRFVGSAPARRAEALS